VKPTLALRCDGGPLGRTIFGRILIPRPPSIQPQLEGEGNSADGPTRKRYRIPGVLIRTPSRGQVPAGFP
jgi:hypothetical protein